jgi:dephospho-CoA kinase
MILERAEERIAAFARSVARGVAITDAALLVETGGFRRYQRLVVVTCEPALQLQRLMHRDALSEPEARARIGAQAPLQQKIALADYHIDTSGTLAQTEQRAHEVWGMLLEDLESLPALPPRRRRA